MSLEKDTLNELFRYEDGKLFWKVSNSNRVKVGDEAGCKEATGYTKINIGGKYYRRHRLIYIMHNGHIPNRLMIDHIDENKNNDKLENLRAVTKQENNWNRTNNKGYYFEKRTNKYVAVIVKNRKQVYLGSYEKEDDARRAYLNAKSELHKIS